MILHLKTQYDEKLCEVFTQKYNPFVINDNGVKFIVSSKIKEIDDIFNPLFHKIQNFDSDSQLTNIEYTKTKREVLFGNKTLGGTTNNTVIVGGPCSIESLPQITEVADRISPMGISFIRAGCFKPRMVLSSTDLPVPDPPTIPMTSPRLISMLSSWCTT